MYSLLTPVTDGTPLQFSSIFRNATRDLNEYGLAPYRSLHFLPSPTWARTSPARQRPRFDGWILRSGNGCHFAADAI